MASFNDLLEKYIKALSCKVELCNEENILQNEAVSLCELHLLELLRNKKIVELAGKYFALSDDERIDFDYAEVLSNGLRLVDFQYVVEVLHENEVIDINVFLLLQTDFASVTFNRKNQEREKMVSLQNDCSVQKKDKMNIAYFNLVYTSEQETGKKAKSFIHIQSNFVCVRDMLKTIFDNTSIVNYRDDGENGFSVIELCNEYEKKLELNDDFIRLIRTQLVNDDIVVIKGEDLLLGELYHILRKYTSFILNKVEKYNRLVHLKEVIGNLNTNFLSIKFNRLPLANGTEEKLNSISCKCIGDLLDISLEQFSYSEVEELLKCINGIDQSTPGLLLHKLMKNLKPTHELVLRKRFFEDDIKTLEEVGKHFGVTRERIRQIESKSIRFFSVPERMAVRGRIIAQMQLLGKFENFVGSSDFSALELSRGAMFFLWKCLDDIYYNSDLNVFFYSKLSEQSFLRAIEEMPTYFTINDFEFYVEYLLVETDNRFSHEEVEYLLKLKYKRYGDYFSTEKLKLGIVIPYLLSLYFPDGLDIYDKSNIEFLRVKAKEHFGGFELSDSNRAISARIQSFCTLVGRGLWKYDINRPLIGHDLLERIVQYLDSYNASIVPIGAIFQAFSEEMSELDITNKYHLQGQLKLVLSGDFKVNRDYVYRQNAESFYRVVENYIKQSKTIVTKLNLLKQFPGITDIVIQQVVSSTRVVNMNGYFLHLDNLEISDEEICALKEGIDGCIVDDSIYHSKMIFTGIKSKMSGLFSRIGVNHYLQFFYLTRELLPIEYSYNRPFMARKGVEIISGEMQVLQKIQGRQEVSIAEVRVFAREVGTVIDRYIEFADRNNDVLLIKDNDTFVSAEFLGLDEVLFANLDEVLEQFLGDAEYKPLTYFYDYWKLPKLKIKWTSWLLYSIINLYSKLYKTAVSSNYIADAVPIVVCEGVEIEKKEIENMKASLYSRYSDDEDELLDTLDIEDIV